MPAGFDFPVGALKPFEFWAPYVPSPTEYPRGDGSSRNYNAQVIGRLKDGVTREQAYADMARITGSLKAQYPKWFRDRWVGVTPLHESIVGKTRGWMFLLLGAVAFVLLIACVNVANLMLARATARTRDIGVRAALGAIALAAGARPARREPRAVVRRHRRSASSPPTGACGSCARRCRRRFRGWQSWHRLPRPHGRRGRRHRDWRVLRRSAGVAVCRDRASWTPSAKAGAPAPRARPGSAARTLLLVAEVALAVVLLVGAGLFVSSFVKLVRVDLGIGTSQVRDARRVSAHRFHAGQSASRSSDGARVRPGRRCPRAREGVARRAARGGRLRHSAFERRLEPLEPVDSRRAEVRRSRRQSGSEDRHGRAISSDGRGAAERPGVHRRRQRAGRGEDHRHQRCRRGAILQEP